MTIPTITVLELAVSLAATWPLVRQLTFPPFFDRNPCIALRRAGLLAGYILFLLLAAFYFPFALHAVALLGSGFLIYERWRARPNYGRSSELPPGSLGLVAQGQQRDASYYEKQVAKYGPIFKLSPGVRPLIYIYGHERGMKFLRDHDDALLGEVLPLSTTLPKGFLRYMHPSEHSSYRKLLQSGISADTINASKPYFSATFRQTLKRLADDCRRLPDGKVDTDDYLRECVLTAFLQVFFGVQPGTPLFNRILSLYHRVDARTEICGSHRRRTSAVDELIVILRQRANSFAKEPGVGPRCFLSVMGEANAHAAVDDTVLGNWACMVEFGLNDVTGLLRWILKMLMDHPAWIDRVREYHAAERDAATQGGESAAERIVKETLRLEQSEALMRRSTREIWFEGYRIPMNWTIRIGIREGHRDPDIFERPTEFDPDRFFDHRYSKTEYSPFGLFRHNCIGAQLTSVISQVFIVELATGYDLLPGEEWKPEFTFHHWRPRRGYRIGLRARTEEAVRKDDRAVSPA